MKTKFILLLTLLTASFSLAQTPTYNLILKNDTLVNDTTYEFDVFMERTGITELELATISPIMRFNTAISSGTLTFTINTGSSQLNSSQQPTSLSIVGNELQIAPRTPPGVGNGTIISTPPGLRIGRFRITSSVAFSDQKANIIWKNSSALPITKVNAYEISDLNVNITDSTGHLSQLNNGSLSPLGISSTSPRPNGIPGALYTDTLNAFNGTPPYNWIISSGSLPTGLSFSSSGIISGTPTTSQTSNFTVRVTDNISATVTKNFSITISHGILNNFLIEKQSGGTIGQQIAGTPFAIKITARDSYNNTVTDFNGTVDITSNGTISSGGGTTVPFVNGILSSHSVTITNASNTISLTAIKTSGSESGTSNTFTVTSAIANRLTIQTQPSSNATAGIIFPGQPVIHIEDTYGNIVTSDNSSIVVATAQGGIGVLQGTSSVTASGGIVAFSNLSYNIAETIALHFASGSLTPVNSDSINVSANTGIKVSVETAADGSGTIVPAQDLTAGNSITAYSIERDLYDNFVQNIPSSWSLKNITGGVSTSDLVPASNQKSSTFTGHLSGSTKIQASSSGKDSTPSGTISVTSTSANHLVFVQQPTSTTAGSFISPSITVQLKDAYDNNVAESGIVVTISLSSGSGILSGTKSRTTDANGVASFNDLWIDLIGSKNINASSGSLTDATSSTFSITHGSSDHLVFVQQPTNTIAGGTISPAVTVQLKDPYENDVTASGISISLEVSSGTDTLRGTKTRTTDANGVATFSDLNIRLIGTKSITATSFGITGAISSPFIISPAAANKISVETMADGSGVIIPAQTIISGSSLSVYAITRDVYNNFISNSIGSWSLDNVTGSVIGTDLVPFDGNRAATFTGHGAGSANIKATSGILTPVSSGTLTVVAGSVHHLSFTRQPSATVAGSIISPAVTVQLKDNLGNDVSIENVAITLSLSNGTGTLSGTLTQLTNNSGLARFSDLSINKSGTKNLSAQSGSLIPAVSDAFSISADTPVAIAFLQQPPSNVVAGATISPAITVQLRDSYDNTVPTAGETITLTLTSGIGPLLGTTSKITDASGTATFSDLSMQKAGAKQLTATRTLFTPVQSNSFNVNPATATKIIVESAPDGNGSIITAQSIVSQNTLTAYAVNRDLYDNFVANDSSAVWSLQFIVDSIKQSDLVFSSACNCATFTARLTGTAQIHVEKIGLTSVNSGTLTVLAGMASRLVYLQQPTDGAAGAIISPSVRIQISDNAGNPISILGDTITISKKTGTGTLNGTKQRTTNSSGNVIFNDLSIDMPGVKTLEATHQSYSAVTSNPFTLSQYTITATAGSHGSISPSGTVNLNYGANQIFYITPEIGYHIFDVLVDGSTVGKVSSYTFTNVTDNHTINATFAIDTLTITASAGANGTISPSGTVPVLYGSNQTFTFIPSVGYHVLNFSVDGVQNPSSTSYTFTNVTANHTISVTFVPDSLTITASAGANGTITPSGNVLVGYATNQLFTITPDTGYHVVNVLIDGSPIGAQTNYTFTNVVTNHSISASFAIDTLTITATAGAHGLISPIGNVKVLFGSDQSFTITPDIGYHILDLLVDGISAGVPTSYSFINVRSNHSISVSFGINTYTITATAGSHGSISPSGSVAANYGSNSSFLITPDLGYHINFVTVDGVPVSIDSTNRYTFTNVTADHTIDASFTPNNITVTVQSNPIGMSFTVDGISYSTTQIFNWIAGESHIISTDSIQPGTTGTRYLWNSWTNGTTLTSIISPLVNTTYTVNFITQRYLTMVANDGGTVTPQSGWFNHGQIVTITAYPDPNYSFNIWSGTAGGYSGRTNPASVTMNQPITETASFTRNPVSVTVQTNPQGRSFVYDGTTYLVKQTFTEQPGTNHTIRIAATTQPGGPGIQYVWNNWSDGGTATHTVFPLTDTTFTANFITQFLLTMTAGTGGTVSPLIGYQDSGAAVLIKAIPNKGYIFKGWTGTGTGSYSGNLDSTLITIGSPMTQSAAFALDTMIITSTAGLHGTISPSGDVKVVYGSSQSFTITPDTLYNISDVVVDGSSVGVRTSYTFLNVTAPHTIVASFTINGYTITASAGPHGSINPSGPIAVDYGSTLSFTIIPDTGYYVDSVFVDGILVDSLTSYTFNNITSNHTISAKFAPNQLIITATAGLYGAISPSGDVNVSYGSSRTFTFLPDTGYHIDSVFIDGVYYGTPGFYTFTNIISTHTISVTFSINKFVISATSGLNGTLNPLGPTIVSYDDSLVVSILPDTGYHTTSVLVDAVNVGAIPSYTFRNIKANHTISATFAINNYTIVSTAGTNGTISPSGTITLPYGSTQRYSIRPGANYHVDSVLVDSLYVGNDTTYTFTQLSSNHTIRAIFAINMISVTILTVPDSLSVVIDNLPYTSPQVFSWPYGSIHSIAATDTQNTKIDTRSLYVNWSDGGTKRHQVVITRDSTFTAFYRPQYYLTMSALTGGSVIPATSWQDSGRLISIRALPSLGYQFDRWTGVGIGSYSDTLNPVNISMLSPISETASFKRYLANVNIATSPAALTIIVDDTLYQSPHLFNWATGSSHTITVVDTQQGATGIRYTWNTWSDSGAKNHTVIPLSDTTFTATFITQYYLTMNANAGGTVTPASGWFNRSQSVQITAIPITGYNFTTWAGLGSGSYSGAINPSAVTMNSPITETANFTRRPVQITIGTNPTGRSFIYNGTTYTATQTRFVDPGSQLTLGAPSPQPDALPDKQWAWVSWSDSGTQAHTVFPTTDTIFTAFFSPQYALTMNILPVNSGTTNPSGKKYYFIGDTVTLFATPAAGYVFTNWSGAISSTDNPAKIIITGSVNVTANFGRAVQISLTTLPSGRRIMVDDSTYTTPKVISWLRGTSHRLSAPSPQSDIAGIRYLFQSWNDFGDSSHYVTPSTDTIYTATFSTQYYLTMMTEAGGTVNPPSDWHKGGDTVQISAVADTDYVFYEWLGTGNGSYTGKLNPSGVIMNEPITQEALFSHYIPPPILTGIADGAIDISTSPNLSWMIYGGANSYNLQISTDSTFTDTTKFILNQRGIIDTSVQISSLANARLYFWRVSVKSGIDESRFTLPRRFTTVGATIAVVTPPVTWATTFTYPISWTSSPTLTGNINIKLSIDSGKSFRLIKENLINNGLTSVTLPDTLATTSIDSCRLRVESFLNNAIVGESNIFSIVSGRLPATVRLSTTIPFAPEPLSSIQYRLFSVPGIVDTLRVGIYPFGVPRIDWRMFSDNGNAENYLIELSLNSYLKTGEGYWLLKKGEFYLPQFDMLTPTLNSDASYNIQIHSGWNIIGNPFDKNIAWQSVIDANSLPASTKLYSYTGSYIEKLALEPFKGYYFFNSSNLTSLKFPYPFGRINVTPKIIPTLWSVKLNYESDLNHDTENYLGIAPIAKQGMDMLDGRKPPLFLDQGFLYFPRPVWDETFQRFSSDFRPEIGQGQTWDFEVANPRKSLGKIGFDGIDNIPGDYRVILINLWNSTPFDLRKQPTYSFLSVIEKMQFKIVIGTEEYIESEIDKVLPKEFELVQNFPNPFNSSTSLSVKLPRDANVKLNIYNSLGQLVKTIAEGAYTAGIHTFVWDGTDASGSITSSGVYFYRLLEGATILQTKKMIMIK
ncbi:MAG: T9SS type A sorting domain-containing protein [Ignavibacteriales bacterium]|nr:T9SS type A sorting domain-containing protein [Ignavibacteriales bacterium]